MKQFFRSFLSIALLLTSMGLIADCCSNSCNNGGCSSVACSNSCEDNCSQCRSIYIPRSAGFNLVREFNPQNYMFENTDCWWGTASLAFEWTRSFKNHRIAECLFGGNDCLSFVGSDVVLTSSRGSNILLGDNFGISPFANGSISFRPRIEHFIIDGQFQVGLDRCWEGLYFRMNMPFDYTRWSLDARCTESCVSCFDTCSNNCSNNCSFNGCSTGCSNNCSFNGCSTGCSTGCSNNCSFNGCSDNCCNALTCSIVTTPFPAGCVGLISQGPVAGAGSIQEALGGDFLFGTMQTPWRFGRFNFCRQNAHKLADIDLILGWNFWQCEDYHLGLFFQATAPTGTKIDSCFARDFFRPVSGNGHHWGIGGGLTGHAELWNCDERAISVWVEGYALHLLRDCQVRTFDFASNGCMSRYMLLKEFTRTAAGTFSATGNLINAVNYNTRFADVKVNVVGEAMIQFMYTHCGWMGAIGYDIWGQSHEDVCIKDGFVDSTLDGRFFGIKGCAPVQAAPFIIGTSATTPPVTTVTVVGGTTVVVDGGAAATALTLNATQSSATATSCGVTDNGVALISPTPAPGDIGGGLTSPCAIGGVPAVGTIVTPGLGVIESAVPTVAGTPIEVTAAGTVVTVAGLTPAPVILTGDPSELNIASGRMPRELSHKVFAHVGYTWRDNEWTPYIDLGGEAEFARSRDCCTINQGGIWLKGGMSF